MWETLESGHGLMARNRASLVIVVMAALLAAWPGQTAQAATFTVTKLIDTNDGACNADCSLREAIRAANATPGHDTIILPSGTLVLTLKGGDDNAALGDLDITTPVTLQGAGSGQTIIDATGLDDRVFEIHPLSSGVVTISGVSVRNGRVTSENGGGVSCRNSTLTMQDVILAGNDAGGNSGGGLAADECALTLTATRLVGNRARQGAGLQVFQSSLTFSHSQASGNEASEAGGGIVAFRSEVTLSFSTLANNSAVGTGGGVFIANTPASLTVTNSLVATNTAGTEAGGILAGEGVVTTIESSTISGNDGGRWGGGVDVRGPTSITHSTITANIAGEPGNGGGGGLFAYMDGAQVQLGHTILAGNTSRNESSSADCLAWGMAQVNSAGWNLVQTAGNCAFSGTGDIIGQGPQLAPLGDNGGPTSTHALLAGSPAHDAGNPAFAPPPQFDQRGAGFPRVVGRIDIGAFETPSAQYRSWLQVASRSAGALGSQWRTDLGLLNSGTTPSAAELRFHTSGGVKTRTQPVAAGQQLILEDVVAGFGVTGSAALEVVSDQPLKVSSRTYSLIAAGASCAPGGTFGQNYDAHTPEQGLASGTSAWLTQLVESAAFRTNIALTNMGSTAASVTVTLFDGAGNQLATYAVNLGPGEYRQENRPFFTKAGQTSMARGSARVSVTQGSGVLASASVVDNITNDPTTMPMRPTTTAPAATSWVQVASRISGVQGSEWRTDLGILNPNTQAAAVGVRFHSGGGTKQSSINVAAGQQAILADVVGQIPATGSAGLEVVASHPVVVSSRTYNQVAAGAACFPGGTLGQSYDAFTSGQALQQGQVAYLTQLRENSAARTNIALTNTGATAAQVTVALLDGGGSQLGQYTVNLNPGEYKQENRPFSTKAGQNALATGYARVTVEQGSGIIASASVVDNQTNDPTTMPAL